MALSLLLYLQAEGLIFHAADYFSISLTTQGISIKAESVLDFQVIPSCVDETADPLCQPQEIVLELAELKAESVSQHHPRAIVLGADTVVVCEGRVLGKPWTKRTGRDAEVFVRPCT